MLVFPLNLGVFTAWWQLNRDVIYLPEIHAKKSPIFVVDKDRNITQVVISPASQCGGWCSTPDQPI